MPLFEPWRQKEKTTSVRWCWKVKRAHGRHGCVHERKRVWCLVGR